MMLYCEHGNFTCIPFTFFFTNDSNVATINKMKWNESIHIEDKVSQSKEGINDKNCNDTLFIESVNKL